MLVRHRCIKDTDWCNFDFIEWLYETKYSFDIALKHEVRKTEADVKEAQEKCDEILERNKEAIDMLRPFQL